ncbi:MAG: capsular biosynthesis protein CpsH [Agathobacter sp.]|nr:capsular biosynthesis protein CpsH [Agathobacter sp.]
MITGDKVLFFALSGYSNGIVKAMQKVGLEVDYFNDKPNDGVICKTLGRYKVPMYQKVLEKYYAGIIDSVKDKEYDYILIIRGEYTPINSLKLLKKTFPNAKLILYMWDSILNNKKIEVKWPYFDKVMTFDKKDYLDYTDQLEFLPLYYYEDCLPQQRETEMEYDIGFIGTGHGDRIKIINEVKKQCEEKGLTVYCFMYLPHKLVYFYNKVTNPAFKHTKINDFAYEKLSFEKVYEIYDKSKTVLDIESITQTGLTMRTLEIIGLHKKLITTNPDIVNYNFYNENNIQLLDRNHPKVDEEFINRQYLELEPSIYKQYSLESWIQNVLS